MCVCELSLSFWDGGGEGMVYLCLGVGWSESMYGSQIKCQKVREFL